MSSVGPKQDVFASLAQIAQALGHAHRLELLEHLGQGERSVEDLATRASEKGYSFALRPASGSAEIRAVSGVAASGP
jgi:DNA-binding transcriptional ArsR family regulator